MRVNKKRPKGTSQQWIVNNYSRLISWKSSGELKFSFQLLSLGLNHIKCFLTLWQGRNSFSPLLCLPCHPRPTEVKGARACWQPFLGHLPGLLCCPCRQRGLGPSFVLLWSGPLGWPQQEPCLGNNKAKLISLMAKLEGLLTAYHAFCLFSYILITESCAWLGLEWCLKIVVLRWQLRCWWGEPESCVLIKTCLYLKILLKAFVPCIWITIVLSSCSTDFLKTGCIWHNWQKKSSILVISLLSYVCVCVCVCIFFDS